MHTDSGSRADRSDADPDGNVSCPALPGEPGDYGLSSWEYTLANLLSDAGYATACYGKWKTMKVHFRLAMSDSWTSPLLTPQIPALYDLSSDPGENKDLMDTELTVARVIRAALAPIMELQHSATDYPHVVPGADFQGY